MFQNLFISILTMYLDQNAGFGVLAFLSGLWPFELGQNLQVRDRVGQVVEAS